jgi:hypothetical protein
VATAPAAAPTSEETSGVEACFTPNIDAGRRLELVNPAMMALEVVTLRAWLIPPNTTAAIR